MLVHPFEPVVDEGCTVLVLGSFPSVKSRENGFYYGHPQNRFWPVLCRVLNEPLCGDNAGKTAMLLRRRIALWDVLQGCDIVGGSDASIKNPVANDILPILQRADIRAIFTTGRRAFELYNRLILPQTRREAICLPSPSPANCAVKTKTLVEEYGKIAKYL